MKSVVTDNLPKNPSATLSFLKLKYGLVELEASSVEVERVGYFVCDSENMSISYLKELIRSVQLAKKEKRIRAPLVVLADKNVDSTLLSLEQKEEGAVFVFLPNPQERATFLVGSLAFVSLIYEKQSEPLYLELMKHGVPLVLPKVEAHQSAVGHAAYFLERVNEKNVSLALSKVENSETLRASIKKAASERIQELSSSR